MDKEIEKSDREAKTTEQVQYDDKTVTFSPEEQEKIVQMVKRDLEADIQTMTDWIEERRIDLLMYQGERPSLIEQLDKDEWMSDRNLGLCAANCDAYQSTLLSTCYNIDRIHFIATEENDVDRKEQLVKFTKWGLAEKEADFYPEVDDFIHNKVTQGISYFYVRWDVRYEWVDKRVPKFGSFGKLFKKYEIVEEYKRFEKGVIENISDVSDLMYPAHGNTLQKKAHLIHRIHKNGREILDIAKRNGYLGVTEDYVRTLAKYCYDNRLNILKKEKLEDLGLTSEEGLVDANDLQVFPIDLFNWYGKYEKDGKLEEWRFTIEPETGKFLAGKQLRKITRSGKRPFVGRPFIRRPGMVRGTSLPRLISDPVNAFNNTWNQKSDFQYVQNCPFGFYNPDEQFKAQVLKIVPGVLLPSHAPESINIPNLTRSLAWADSDFRILFETIERLTGAASYFMSNTKGVSGTATRDALINEKSETRFGLWVNRIVLDLNEAITMWLEMYQDWGDPKMGERILGEDGKKLFKNFSIDTIRGGYDARLSPDIISGSKTLQKEISLWALESLSQSPWFDIQFNPKGSWNLIVRAAKDVGFEDIERYMPPEPKAEFRAGKNVEDKWTQIKQGDMPIVEDGDDIMELYMGFMQLNEDSRDEVDAEYLPNLDVFMFKLHVRMIEDMKRQSQEQQANKMALDMIQSGGGQPNV